MAETWWRPVSDAIADLAQPEPGAVLVDLGCGDGVSLAATAARFPSTRLLGLDLNTDAITHARRRLQDVPFVVADLTQLLPLADRSVDVVICHNVLVRHEAPHFRVEVRDVHRSVVAAAG